MNKPKVPSAGSQSALSKLFRLIGLRVNRVRVIPMETFQKKVLDILPPLIMKACELEIEYAANPSSKNRQKLNASLVRAQLIYETTVSIFGNEMFNRKSLEELKDAAKWRSLDVRWPQVIQSSIDNSVAA